MSAKYLSRPDGRIAYEETGTGPLAVLVPGIGDVRAEYRFLAPALAAARHRVVTMDLRGLGESDATFSDYSAAAVGADIVALLRELGAGPANPAHLVGDSLGAGAVAWAAAEAPDLVESLTLIGAFVRDIPPTSRFQAALLKVAVNTLFRRPWGALAWDAFYNSLYTAAKPADFATYRTALKRNVAERGRIEAVRAMLNASKANVDARLDSVRARTLVVMGSADPDFTTFAGGAEGEARLIAERLRGTVLMIPGAGHYPHAELPALTNPAIVSFITETNTSTSPTSNAHYVAA
jgi:pimeloyl-ACP methyl ester carboxylesterase